MQNCEIDKKKMLRNLKINFQKCINRKLRWQPDQPKAGHEKCVGLAFAFGSKDRNVRLFLATGLFILIYPLLIRFIAFDSGKFTTARLQSLA